ncbi:hypothetical protein, partial [Candidatus Acetatifactor stercoripullorum]|uniref:hypothetical protein n=1 Tax=Candidatus Acetatifactor stercoripullorum TaxID=2838414 RepID=UPI00298EA3D1
LSKIGRLVLWKDISVFLLQFAETQAFIYPRFLLAKWRAREYTEAEYDAVTKGLMRQNERKK